MAVLNKQKRCFFTVTTATDSCVRYDSINIINYSVETGPMHV